MKVRVKPCMMKVFKQTFGREYYWSARYRELAKGNWLSINSEGIAYIEGKESDGTWYISDIYYFVSKE